MTNTEISEGIEEYLAIKTEETEKKTGQHNATCGHTEQLMRVVSADVSYEFSIYRVRQRNKKSGSTTRIWMIRRVFANGLLIKTRITKFAFEVIESLKWSERLEYCEKLSREAKRKTIVYEKSEAA